MQETFILHLASTFPNGQGGLYLPFHLASLNIILFIHVQMQEISYVTQREKYRA